MKIAVLSPIAWSTPPKHYGPWEQVASTIAEGLIARGHEVSLYATGDSKTSGKLEWVLDVPYAESGRDAKVWECLHISHLMERAEAYDIIHNNYDFLPLSYSGLITTPMLTTIHGFSSEKILPVYKKYNKNTHYIAISDANRHPELRYLETIYHGVDAAHFTYQSDKKDFLLYFGRIHPEKGTHEAILIALESNLPLKIAGLIQDQSYFDHKVKPYLDEPSIEYLGNLGGSDRVALLGLARALLHPISFEEPFGLSVAEALMCGTPVIAYNRGSMPELIEEARTGFLVKNKAEAVDALKKIDHIKPADCRSRAEKLFSLERMISSYERVYERILNL